MGLMQRAYETYCAMERSHAGRYSAEEKETLAPACHTLVKADLEITLDEEGGFVSACGVDKNEPKIVIPVTEASAGRTGSTPPPHPLSDQLSYLAPYQPQKYQAYLDQLRRWEHSDHTHPKLTAVLRYVERGTILKELLRSELIGLDENGIPTKEKQMVRWRILSEDGVEECWKDAGLFQAFIAYCGATEEGEKAYCMILGQELRMRTNHPKATVPAFGNAKIISYKDDKGLGVNDRFRDKLEEATVSDIASQKAHSALRWLAVNQGVSFGGRTFLCWDPQGKKLPKIDLPMLRDREQPFRPTQYQQELENTLKGWQDSLPPDATAVIAAFDAATSGRLSVTYYNELQGSDFLERLHRWDRTCCWYNGPFGVQSPSVYQIAKCAFGVPRTSQGKTKLEVDERVLGQQVQRLLRCRIDGQPIPRDVLRGLMDRCADLQLLDMDLRESLLFTACAVIRKYHYDKFKEEWNMALEPEKRDRSYQFGRLLAVLEKAERDTYDSNEAREPNAMRMQAAFVRRPYHVACQILVQVKKAYYPRLKPFERVLYDRLVGQIMEQISLYQEQGLDQPLKDTYLLGYYLQKNKLDPRRAQNNKTEE